MPQSDPLLAANSLLEELLLFLGKLTPVQQARHKAALLAVNNSIGALVVEIATAESAGIAGARKDIERMVGARIIKDALGVGELALSKLAMEQAEAELRALGVNPDEVRKEPLEGLDDITILGKLKDEMEAELLAKGVTRDDFDEALESDP